MIRQFNRNEQLSTALKRKVGTARKADTTDALIRSLSQQKLNDELKQNRAMMMAFLTPSKKTYR